MLLQSYRNIVNFTTTLQILRRNKQLLQPKQKQNNEVANIGSNLVRATAHSKNKLYESMNKQWIRATYLQQLRQCKQLQVLKNKLQANQHLAGGEDIDNYPLGKIINICLKNKHNNVTDTALWQKLQARVLELSKNVSAVDNIVLLYIGGENTFTLQTRNKIIKDVYTQLPLMTHMEKQLLFYTLCHIVKDDPTSGAKDTQLSSNQQNDRKQLQQIGGKKQQVYYNKKLNSLKQQLINQSSKTKLPLKSQLDWIMLLCIGNGPQTNVAAILNKYKKLESLALTKSSNIISIQQFYSLLMCLQYRGTLADEQISSMFIDQGRDFINFYTNKVNRDYMMMINSMKTIDRINMKMILSQYFPQVQQYTLTNDQLLHKELPNKRVLKYLHWLWKHNKKQDYQIKSIYQSVELDNHQKQSNIQNQVVKMQLKNFRDLDLVFYVCLLEMGLKTFRNYNYIIEVCRLIEYVPRGLSWPIYNYFAQVVKHIKTNANQMNLLSKISQIIQGIKQTKERYDKQQKLAEYASSIRGSRANKKNIDEVEKFFHQIKIWSFQVCKPIAPVDYIAHFVDQKSRIILHCLNRHNYVNLSPQKMQNIHDNLINKGYQANQVEDNYNKGQSEQHQQPVQVDTNNQHKLNKRLLYDNFGLYVIDVRVQQFMAKNYNERIQWLSNQISKGRKMAGYIQ